MVTQISAWVYLRLCEIDTTHRIVCIRACGPAYFSTWMWWLGTSWIYRCACCWLLLFFSFFPFFVACGRIGLTSRWTSLTACKQSQAWVSLTNLLILWISTQSCDNDTSWADLAGQTAGGRGGKAICSCKEHERGAGGWGLWLLILPTKPKKKKEKYIPPSLCP